ncbi:MAG: class I SAM-dependent methyltransferase [Candidatus Heimdallarchaeota archaeon]
MSFLKRCRVESNIQNIISGLKDYNKRMLAQAVIRSPLDFNAFLQSPKTIVEIAEAKNLRNLKLIELVLEILANYNILKHVGAKYQWQGYDFKVTDNETEFTKTGPAVAKYNSALADALYQVLQGDDNGKISLPLVALDAFFSSDFVKLIINQAISLLNEFYPASRDREIIIDLFGGTGWSTIYLAKEFSPKKIYALEPRDRRLTLIAQENVNIVLEEPMATAIEFLSTPLTESPIREKVDLIFGFEPFQWTMPSDWLQLVKRSYSLLKEDGYLFGFQLMRNQSSKGALAVEPVWAVLQQFTQLPTVESINSMLIEGGFIKPTLLCSSYFFAQK